MTAPAAQAAPGVTAPAAQAAPGVTAPAAQAAPGVNVEPRKLPALRRKRDTRGLRTRVERRLVRSGPTSSPCQPGRRAASPLVRLESTSLVPRTAGSCDVR